MFKRTFWFTTGATAGFGGAMWIRRQVLRTVRRYTPDHVQAEVASSVRRIGDDLRRAVREGRSAMADREAELRAELRPGVAPATTPGPQGAHTTAPPVGGAHTTVPPVGGAHTTAPVPAARRANGRRRHRRSPVG